MRTSRDTPRPPKSLATRRYRSTITSCFPVRGSTALSSVLAATGQMNLMTTVALPVVRGPVALAKSMAAIDILSGGRLVVGVGPGSSAGTTTPQVSPSRNAGSGSMKRWGRCAPSGAKTAAI